MSNIQYEDDKGSILSFRYYTSDEMKGLTCPVAPFSITIAGVVANKYEVLNMTFDIDHKERLKALFQAWSEEMDRT